MQMGSRKKSSLPVRAVELEVRQVSEGGERDAGLLQISLREVEVQDRSVRRKQGVCVRVCVCVIHD